MTEAEAKTKWPVSGRKAGHSKGYIRLLCPQHPNSGEDNYVYEHTYVATTVIGRALRGTEVAHHIDGNPANNENSNLLICTKKYHQQLHERLSRSDDWPQFVTKKKNHRPTCNHSGCGKKISYASVTGYCWGHYWENRDDGKRSA